MSKSPCKKWKLNPYKHPDTDEDINEDNKLFKSLLKKCKSEKMSESNCSFLRTTAINPLTGRKLDRNGSKYKSLEKTCNKIQPEDILCSVWLKERVKDEPRNPKTGRKISPRGKVFRELDKECDKYFKSSPKKRPIVRETPKVPSQAKEYPHINVPLYLSDELEAMETPKKTEKTKESGLCLDVLNLVSDFSKDKFILQFIDKSTYKKIKFDIQMFIDACSNGHLNVAKWLLQFNPNVHALNDEAFRSACKNGHLDVAKWLIQFNPDVHVLNDYVFRKSPAHIVEWLKKQL